MVDKDKHEINHKLVDVKRAQARGVAPPSIHEKQMAAAAAAAAAAAMVSSTTAAAAATNHVTTTSTHVPTPRTNGGMNSSFHGDGVVQPAGGASSHQQPELSPEQLHCKIFVGGIPPQIDRDELKQIFEEYGTVIDAIVMVDQITQRSRCFGFVTFDPAANGASSASRAIAAQPLSIQGRNVEVKLATPRAEQVGGGAVSGGGASMAMGGSTGMTKRTLPPVAKHVGLRAGQASTVASGEFAGLSVAYGRSGWKAGYGTKAFGSMGWNVWEDTGGPVPEQAGFSFQMLKATTPAATKSSMNVKDDAPRLKRARH
jgi:RNA recognition motif. (a.k.a. RRM, RBD, or RNP domain)